ncbi:hypothetical protein ACHAW6_003833, partial [Cyclotella cf. meneghiniana]
SNETMNVDIIRTMNLLGRGNDLSLLPRVHQREVVQVFTAAKTLMLMATDDYDSSDDDIVSHTSSIDDSSVPYDGIDDSSAPTITLYDPADEGRISDIHTVFRRDIYEGYIVPPGARYAGTVAFRCRFCKHFPSEARASQSWVFPRTIEQMYRAHIRFNREHFPNCKCIPDEIRAKVAKLKKSSCRGSKNYWITSALKKGLVNGDKGIVLCGQAAQD